MTKATLKIEAGKYYRTRAGRKAGPIKRSFYDGYAFSGGVEGGRELIWQEDGTHGSYFIPRRDGCDLVAEWIDAPAEPNLWRDMTPAEKGALLLAAHEGKVIQSKCMFLDDEEWEDRGPLWDDEYAYRVKPAEPVVETVTLYDQCITEWSDNHPCDAEYCITLNLIDGRPDPASIKMKEL